MEYYRPILAFHVIAIISWMAGILYLFRILVHGAERRHEHPKVESILQMMAFKLYKYITVPAMVASWIAGIAMAWLNTALWHQPWFIVKFISAILLSGATGYAGKLTKQFNRGEELPAGKTLRFVNEIPTIFMIVIVIMVIMRPF